MIRDEDLNRASALSNAAHRRRQEAQRARLADPTDADLEAEYKAAKAEDDSALRTFVELMSARRWQRLSAGLDPICGNGRDEFCARWRGAR